MTATATTTSCYEKPKRRKPWRRATELTRRYYAARGYHVAFVERQLRLHGPWRGVVARRVDAWGFADHLCFKVGRPGMVAVNSCKGFAEIRKHVEKFRLLSVAHDWLVHDVNNRIVILAWDRAERPGACVRMRCRQLRLADFEPRDGDRCEWKPKIKRKEKPCDVQM